MSRQNGKNFGQQSFAVAVREDALPQRAGAPAGFERFGLRDVREALHRELAAIWAACGMFECVALSYLGTSSFLIVLFAQNVAHPLRLLGIRGFVAAVILAVCRIEAAVVNREAFKSQAVEAKDSAAAAGERLFQPRPTLAERFWHFWRHWYPHLFFLFCFEEMGKLVHLVQPQWQDAKLIAFDQWLTGVNSSLWLERFTHPAVNEFMAFSYFNYFLFLLILGGVLYQRRDWKSYWAVMTYSAVGYSLGYVIATLFPVQSPWFTFAGMWHSELAGGPFTALINLIEKCGRVHGAAFPSQHVAGAMAALWGAWRHRRWLFWVFLPFVICMCVSTVYVRNHYVADVLGGLVTGTLGYVIGCWLLRRQSARAANSHALMRTADQE